jgi:hypothetical protein
MMAMTTRSSVRVNAEILFSRCPDISRKNYFAHCGFSMKA